MTLYQKQPVQVEAVQFTGDNWHEMHAFTGHRETSDGHKMDVFNDIGTYLVPEETPNAIGELWVEANTAWLPIEIGEWVIQDKLGFYPCKDEVFKETYIEVVELPT